MVMLRNPWFSATTSFLRSRRRFINTHIPIIAFFCHLFDILFCCLVGKFPAKHTHYFKNWFTVFGVFIAPDPTQLNSVVEFWKCSKLHDWQKTPWSFVLSWVASGDWSSARLSNQYDHSPDPTQLNSTASWVEMSWVESGQALLKLGTWMFSKLIKI